MTTGEPPAGRELPVSLVVVAYRDPRSLRGMMTPLVGSDLELIVVNVTCDPDVEAVCRDLGLRHVPLEGNRGFAAAVNIGADLASGRVLVFANDDLGVTEGGLRRLAAVADRFGVALPRHLDADGSVRRSIQPLVTPWTLLFEWMLLPDRPVGVLSWLPVQKWRSPEAPERVQAATAAMVAARTGVLRSHPLPESYFMYWEEAEWFWTLRRAGVQTWYVPDAAIVRCDGRSVVTPEKTQLMARNAVRLVRRVHGRHAAAAAWVVVVGWMARLWAIDVIRSACRRSDRSMRSARSAGLAAAMRAIREVR